MKPRSPLKSLAEFRYQIRRFLDFSRGAARRAGLAPQQHQMLLVIAAGGAGPSPSIRALSHRMFVNHNTAVELANRLERKGLARRMSHPTDRRRVTVRITPRGRRVLTSLARHHFAELRTHGPELVRALRAVIRGARRVASPRTRARRPRR
ncbi:MAG TPA: MarR family transcriptional regulator [Candidatus Acidoferrales bacterium]|nr:MarR family transcriptional regulator [Candidatus Acidoferrales bacterium]